LEGIGQNVLIIILIVADLAVCAVVVLYFFRGRSQDQRPVDTVRVRKLVDSLSELVKESERASRNLLDALNERHRRTEELFRQLDTREKRMAEAIRKVDSVVLKSESHELTEKYKEVSRLADHGLSADEIGGRVKLPKGEIELILGLKR